MSQLWDIWVILSERLSPNVVAYPRLGRHKSPPFPAESQRDTKVFNELIAAELCTDYALNGQWDEALLYARQALNFRRYAVVPLVIPARWSETAAFCWGGDVALAREDVRQWGHS